MPCLGVLPSKRWSPSPSPPPLLCAQVTLTSLAAVSCTLEPVKKKLPASSMTVGKLKQLCKRLFKVDTDQQVGGWCVPNILGETSPFMPQRDSYQYPILSTGTVTQESPSHPQRY